MTRPLENPMVVGAEAAYDALCDAGEKFELAVDAELVELLNDVGYVEEAISQQADVIRAGLVKLRAARSLTDYAVASDFMWSAIRSYLRPIAARCVERRG